MLAGADWSWVLGGAIGPLPRCWPGGGGAEPAADGGPLCGAGRLHSRAPWMSLAERAVPGGCGARRVGPGPHGALVVKGTLCPGVPAALHGFKLLMSRSGIKLLMSRSMVWGATLAGLRSHGRIGSWALGRAWGPLVRGWPRGGGMGPAAGLGFSATLGCCAATQRGRIRDVLRTWVPGPARGSLADVYSN